MSPRARSPVAEAGDLVDAPFIDDAERAESEWLLARERDPGARAPSESIAQEYEHLENMLGTLPAGPSDERWHDDVLRAASSWATSARPGRRRRLFTWALGSGLAAAATLAVILLVLRPSELEVAIRHGTQARGADEAVVGDRMTVEARPQGGLGDLRVFQANGIPVAKCPNGPGCRFVSGGHYVIDLTLDKPVQYQVILVVGDGAALSKLPDGAMSGYLTAAGAANLRITVYRTIDVH
jgi:hypothetical protein